jgi:hypothetical protein
VTLIGDIGPWGERVVLVGGLAPLYIAGSLPLGAPPHAGTTDVDLVVSLAVDDSSDTYKTLHRNLIDSGFGRGDHSYQWCRSVDQQRVDVEFLCETDRVEPGRIFQPGQGTGAQFGAFNAPGARLATQDFIEIDAEAERLDGGGLSRVTFRVAAVLPYVVLKVLAFQDRHENKDIYDLVYTLMNFPTGGADAAGLAAAASPVRKELLVVEALQLLGDRFASIEHDGPIAYSNFLSDHHDTEGRARHCNEAAVAVDRFLVAASAK